MKHYRHLSLDERKKLGILQGEGKSIRNIAKILGRSPSTIKREFDREEADKYRGKYIASTTHKLQPFIERAQNGEKFSSKEIAQIHDNIAEIYFLLANAAPYYRGSNGITDIFMRSIYEALNIEMPAIKRGVSLDLEAFCVDLNVYQNNWLSFFESQD